MYCIHKREGYHYTTGVSSEGFERETEDTDEEEYIGWSASGVGEKWEPGKGIPAMKQGRDILGAGVAELDALFKQTLRIDEKIQKPIDDAEVTEIVSDCLRGHVAKVEKFVFNHADNRLRYVLRDYEDDNGSIVVCLVAGRTDNPQMLTTLLREFPTLKSVWDKRGRTPLMEATLWGRLKNVQVLLANGATQDPKDGKRRSAIDTAMQNRRNARERYLLRKGSMTSGPMYSIPFGDDNYETDEARKAIVRLLSPPPAPYRFDCIPYRFSLLPGPGETPWW